MAGSIRYDPRTLKGPRRITAILAEDDFWTCAAAALACRKPLGMWAAEVLTREAALVNKRAQGGRP